MKKAWVGLASFITLLVLLAACGGQNAASSVDPKVTASTLNTVSEQLQKIQQPLALAGFPVEPVGAPLSGGVAPLDTASWNCDEVQVTGNLTDVDRDNIPVDATYNGKCTWSYTSAGGSVNGSWEFKNMEVKDPNDSDPDAGISVTGSIVYTISASDSGTITWTWNFDKHSFVKNGATYNFDYEGSWEVSSDGGTFSFNYTLIGTWAPDDASDPWGDGVLNVTSGSFSGSCDSGSWNVSFTITNAHYSGGRIISGSASFTGTDCDGNSASISVTWSADQVCINGNCYPN
ncbi:hypothetical protein [Oceanithermus sp.]